MNDLVVRSDERRSLWNSLRERSSEGQTYHAGFNDVEIDDNLLAALLGLKDIL